MTLEADRIGNQFTGGFSGLSGGSGYQQDCGRIVGAGKKGEARVGATVLDIVLARIGGDVGLFSGGLEENAAGMVEDATEVQMIFVQLGPGVAYGTADKNCRVRF